MITGSQRADLICAMIIGALVVQQGWWMVPIFGAVVWLAADK